MTRTLAGLRIRAGLFAFVASALCVGASAQMTTVTAPSGTLKVAGTTIATGTINWTPVDLATGIPVAVRAGTVVYDIQAIPCTVTAGAINAGCNVPDLASAVSLTPNVQLGYNVRISDSSTNKGFTIQGITGVTGSTWSLTTYSPTQVTPVSASSITTGSSVPSACRGAAIFYTQTNPPLKYDCVGNIFAQETTSGGSGVSIVWKGAYSSGTTYAVNDSTSLNGSSYISLQASNINHQPDTSSSFWGLMAAKGADGAIGTPGTAGSNGTSPVITIGTVTPLSAGATPTATLTGSASNPVLNLGLPAGATGANGTSPAAPTFTVGTVGTGSAAVTITGSAPNYTLNFTFPSGVSSVTLKTNGTNNGSQTVLNLKPGSGISVADDGTGGVTIGLSATINGKAISTNPSLNASDVGADASGAAATVASNLSAEVTRATGVEGGLSSSIGSETTRATAAETANSIPDVTVSALPTPVAGLLGRKYVVTDGVAGSVCSTGGGAVRTICEVYTVSTGVYGYRSVAQGAGEKGVANGIASLDANVQVPQAQTPTVAPAYNAGGTAAAGSLSYPQVNYDSAGRITSIVGVLHMSYTGGCWGTSYDYGSGATELRNGYCARMKKNTPTIATWLGNFAVPSTTQPTIALSVLANLAPSATYPSTWYIGHGENDYTQCPTGTVDCQRLFTRSAMAGIYWGAVAPQQRTLGTNMTKSGSWTVNTALAPINAFTGSVSGSAIQSVTNGDTITIAVPSTNNGAFELFLYAPTGTTGATFTLTNSTTSTNYTDICNAGSTTINAFACNGTAAWAGGPWALRFATQAGVANTVTLTHTNTSALTVIAYSYTTSTLAANTNAVIARNAGPAYDISGWTATSLASIVTQARSDGLVSVMLSDARSAISGVVDGSSTGGVSQVDSPVFGSGSTQPNHPRNYTHMIMEQAALQAQATYGYVVSVIGAGIPDPETFADTRLLQLTTPFNPLGLNTWLASYRNENADSNYLTYGKIRYGGGGTSAFLERIGSGTFPDGGSGPYHASVLPSSGRECVQKFTTANVTTESNFTNTTCVDANGNSTQSGYALTLYNVRTAGTVLASATTITPIAGITHVSGTTAITTITVPAGCALTGKGCDLTLVPDGTWSLATGGNIALSSTAVVSRPMVITWVNADAKWYPSY